MDVNIQFCARGKHLQPTSCVPGSLCISRWVGTQLQWRHCALYSGLYAAAMATLRRSFAL